MSESTARQLSLLDEVRTPDIRFDAPRAPGSGSSRRAAEVVTDSPFRRTSWRRILVALYRLPVGAMLSQEEIAARVEMKDGPCCGRLSELKTLWVEMVPDALISKAGVAVNGHRLSTAGRSLFGERKEMEQTKR